LCLLADAMLLAGVAAYFLAWWLEEKTEGRGIKDEE